MPKTKRRLKTAARYKRHSRGFSRAFKKVYWPYIPVLLTIGTLLFFGSQNGLLQAAARHPTSKVLAYATSMSVAGLLTDSNTARASNGVAPLHLNSQLDAAAQAKANDMAARDYWSHNTPDGNPPWVFVTSQGYSYQKLGENLAAGFGDEQLTINGWMASPGHRENLLDSAFSDVGFGYANIADYTAAGGGPMTIVVSFYGQPVTPAPAPSAPSTPAATVPTAAAPSVKNSATQAAPTPAPASVSSPVSNTPKATQPPQTTEKKPVTTQTPASSATAKSTPASGAKVAFARLPHAGFIASFVGAGVFLTFGLWMSRHALQIRRAWRRGERYVIAHPMFDLALLTLAVLSLLLSKTAGLIL